MIAYIRKNPTSCNPEGLTHIVVYDKPDNCYSLEVIDKESFDIAKSQLLAEKEKVRKLKEAAKECLLMVKADYRSLFLEDSETAKKVRQTLKEVEEA